jgi:hypothetical protein
MQLFTVLLKMTVLGNHVFELRNELYQHLSEKRHSSAHMYIASDFDM